MQTHQQRGNHNHPLLIQQNNEEMLNRSAGEERFRVMTKNSTSSGMISGKYIQRANPGTQGSARRLPMRQLDLSNNKQQSYGEMTPGTQHTATDTVMYLKQ